MATLPFTISAARRSRASSSGVSGAGSASMRVFSSTCSGADEEEAVSQFFHILGSVAQTRGCARAGEDGWEITVYSSCCSMDRGVYYYTTYGNSRVSAVDMFREELDGNALASYPLAAGLSVNLQN